MSIFGDYARYYNLLYQHKEYAAETEFILDCLTRYGGMPATLLDLGCGTGRHALEMARRGVSVTGVDMSATMLEMGRQLQAASPDLPAGVLPPQLQEGDARTVRLGKRFDAVTSLFHVIELPKYGRRCSGCHGNSPPTPETGWALSLRLLVWPGRPH